LQVYGFEGYLRFLRGGYDAWKNPGNAERYKYREYLHGLAETLRVIMPNRNSILSNNTRFWVNVAYV
jgi:hypothetical protein